MAGAVAVIDTQFNNVIATIDVGPFPSGVVVAPHGTRAYSNTVTATVRGNPFPSTVTITPDGNFAYVLDTESNPQVIDTTTRESTFPLERVIDGTGRIAFAPDGLLAYVVGEGIDEVEVLEVATRTPRPVYTIRRPTSRITITGNAQQITVGPARSAIDL